MRLLSSILIAVISYALVACAPVVTASYEDIDYGNFDGVSVGYFLPKSEIGATVAYDSQTDTIKITRDAAPTTTADLDAGPQVAVYRHSQFSKDVVTIQTDTSGLLSLISTETADQTIPIVTAIGNIGTSFSSLKSALDAGEKQKLTADTSSKCPNMTVPVTKKLTYWRRNDDANVNSLTVKAGAAGQTCSLYVAMRVEPPPYAASATAYSGAAPEKPEVCDRTAICFRAAAGFTVTIAAVLIKQSSPPLTIDRMKAACKEPINPDLVICGKVETPTVVAPIRQVGHLYFNRRPFVDNSVSATFTNGMLTKMTVTDPSVIAAALDLPVEVLKTLGILVKL